MKNGYKPAFPTEIEVHTAFGSTKRAEIGLTKREHYAGLAMQGLLALPDKGTYGSFDEAIERICEVSVKFADELLKQLENK